MQDRYDGPADFFRKLQNYNTYFPITAEHLNNEHFKAVLTFAPVTQLFEEMYRVTRNQHELALGKLVRNHILGLQFLFLNQPENIRKKIAEKYCNRLVRGVLRPITSFSVEETYWQTIQTLLCSWVLDNYAEREKEILIWLKSLKYQGLKSYRSPKPNLAVRPLGSSWTGSYKRDFQRLILNPIFERIFNQSLLSHIRFSIAKFLKVVEIDLSANKKKLLNRNFEILWFDLHKLQLKAFQDISKPSLSYSLPIMLLGLGLLLICITTQSFIGILLCILYASSTWALITHNRNFDREIKAMHLKETLLPRDEVVLRQLYEKFKIQKIRIFSEPKTKPEAAYFQEFKHRSEIKLKKRKIKKVPKQQNLDREQVEIQPAASTLKILRWIAGPRRGQTFEPDQDYLYQSENLNAYLVPSVFQKIRHIFQDDQFSFANNFCSLLRFTRSRGYQGLVPRKYVYKVKGEFYISDYMAKFVGLGVIGRTRVLGFFGAIDNEREKQKVLILNKVKVKKGQ